MARTHERAIQYVEQWRARGYAEDIPDSVPDELMRLGLAPSYKAIALAILNADMGLEALGFINPASKWYGAIKRHEIAGRASKESDQP